MANKYLNNLYFGIVEDIDDPKRQGRIKVRVQSVYEGIALSHLPWVSPYIIPSGKEFNVPPIGKIVNIFFEKGSIYAPYYTYTDKFNINLQDKLESMGEDDYGNFNALLFDHRTQIYSETEQLTLDFKLNKLTFDNESINLELKDNAQKLNLGTKSADQPVILGREFMDWFNQFVRLMINPANMNAMGSPVVKPAIDLHLNQFMMNRGSYLSTNVFVPSNNAVDTLQRETVTSEVEHDDLGIVSPNDDFGVSIEGDNTGSGSSTGTEGSTGSTGSGSSTSSKEINTSTDVKELSNEKQNVEETNVTSKESKDKLKKKQKKESKDVGKSKPKLVIRIPIPYTDKYITIKLSLLLGILGGALLAFIAFKIFSKLTANMSGGFPIQEQDMDVDEDIIKAEIDEIDMNEISDGNGNLVDSDGNLINSDGSLIDTTDGDDVGDDVGSGDSDGNDGGLTFDISDEDDGSDSYSKKKNKYKNSPYSYLNRGRTDLLDSDNVKNRNPHDKGTKRNNNYGSYY